MIVVWRVTDNCNLTCPFCAFDRNLKRPRREADAAVVLALGEILAEYARISGEAVLVSWLGGEPLLWPPLAELTETYDRRFGLKVSTTTNGSPLIAPEMRTHVLAHYAELTVSVDGMGAAHDALRGWPGGYAAIRYGIQALAQEKRRLGQGPRLRANVVLMRDNVAHLESLCLELASWGVETVTFNQLGGNDRPAFYPGHRLLPHQADWLAAKLPRLRARSAAAGLQLQGGRAYIRRIQATAHGTRLPVADCSPGKGFLFIDETGLAAPCSFTLGDFGVPAEEIDSVEALCGLIRHFAGRRRRRVPAACSDCLSNQVFDKFVEE